MLHVLVKYISYFYFAVRIEKNPVQVKSSKKAKMSVTSGKHAD